MESVLGLVIVLGVVLLVIALIAAVQSSKDQPAKPAALDNLPPALTAQPGQPRARVVSRPMTTCHVIAPPAPTTKLVLTKPAAAPGDRPVAMHVQPGQPQARVVSRPASTGHVMTPPTPTTKLAPGQMAVVTAKRRASLCPVCGQSGCVGAHV